MMRPRCGSRISLCAAFAMAMIILHRALRTMPQSISSLTSRSSKSEDSWSKTEKESGQWRRCKIWCTRAYQLMKFLKIYSICFKCAHGTSASKKKNGLRVEELTSFLVSSKEMTVKLIATSGFSKEFANILSRNRRSCLILVPNQMSMLLLSCTNTWWSHHCAEAAVVRLKWISTNMKAIHHICWELHNISSTKWVIPLTRLAKASSAIALCCPVPIACSDGKQFKVGQWTPSLSWSIRSKIQTVQKLTSILLRIESCACKFILSKVVGTIW